MAKRVQFRRGTSTQHNSFTGALGEVTVDTTLKTLRVHDNVKVGGNIIATQDVVNNTAYTIETIEELINVPVEFNTVIVKDIKRGGTFVSKTGVDIDPNTGSVYVVNGGTVFTKLSGSFWVREIGSCIDIEWFGSNNNIALSNADTVAASSKKPLLINVLMDITSPVTITSNIIAPNYQIFTNTSLVKFNKYTDIKPQWFGYSDPIPLTQYSDKLNNNVAVVFECFGDSTMFGADPFNLPNQVVRPAPAQLQIILRVYYGNSAAIVINSGINSTNINQMLNGTDGSGLTFDARVKSSSASVIYCNHCLNSVTNSNLTIEEYKNDLISVIRICKKYGKTLVLETPNIMGAFEITTIDWNNRLKEFVETIRSISKEFNIPLVDNFSWCEKLANSGKYKIAELIGDGIHPTQMLYLLKGQNMAIPLIAERTHTFNKNNQFLVCTDTSIQSSSGSTINTFNSRFSKTLATKVGDNSIRIAYIVEDGGLDIYSSMMSWIDGSSAVSIVSEETTLISNDYSLSLQLGTNNTFVTDQEVKIIENIQAGLHILKISCTSGALAFNYLRARNTDKQIANRSVTGSVSTNFRKNIIENLEITTNGEGTINFEEMPISTLLNKYEIELSATLQKNTGLVIHGLMTTNTALEKNTIPAVIVGLDSSGFLCIWENDLTTLNKTVIMSGEDYSLVPRRWYISVTKTTIQVIDYTSNGVATLFNKTKPYYGGFLGFWRLNSGTSTIDKLVKIQRF